MTDTREGDLAETMAAVVAVVHRQVVLQEEGVEAQRRNTLVLPGVGEVGGNYKCLGEAVVRVVHVAVALRVGETRERERERDQKNIETNDDSISMHNS